MTGAEIVERVKELRLPEGSYVVFGSGPLAAANIREARDVDLLVSKEVLNNLKEAGWQKIVKAPGDEPYIQGVFEAHDNWDFSSYSPTFGQLLETATIIDDVPFASLEEVRKWKVASGGPKHMVDVALIDLFLADKEAFLASKSMLREMLLAWATYLDELTNWEALTEGITPKPSGCGLIYEMPNPISDRSNEDFCIADMRQLPISEPHYHSKGVIETYFIIQGSGKTFVRNHEYDITAGSIIVMPPVTTHYTIAKDVVLAAVTTPSFQPEDYIPIAETSEVHGFDKAKYEQLKATI